MQNIDNLALSLDAQVLSILEPLHFSDSPLVWGNELDPLLSEIYWTMVRRTKDDIRAVAQGSRQAYRVDRLLHYLQDINERTGVLRTMLMAVDLVRSHESGVSSRIAPRELRRLQDEIPTLRNAMRSIMNRFSALQEEFGACVDVFSILEGPMEAIELLLSSLSSTLPTTYLVHGEVLMERLVRLWSERRTIVVQAVGLAPESRELQQLVGRLNDQREDQGSILRSFTGLINQISEVPPLHFVNQEFAARQFSGANWVFRHLYLGRGAIIQDIECLKNTLDHFLDVIGASEE
ncbi:hypothetical protein LXA43DRAFT_1100431 [Ganoderma leucocontextum]|nr:hypothetical protein LXA43DRAFT_1100431 [Ganoderma leucocontextum]